MNLKKKIVDTSGTSGYMAPETIFGEKHGYASDFFSLGVICYEMMMKRRPYPGMNRQEIKEKWLVNSSKLKMKKYQRDGLLNLLNLLINF